MPYLLGMNNANGSGQLIFGLMSGVTPVDPWAEGDILVTHSGKRVVVVKVDSNDAGAVFVAVNLSTGADCVVLEREVAYRSR